MKIISNLIILLIIFSCSNNTPRTKIKKSIVQNTQEPFILPDLPSKIKFANAYYSIEDIDVKEKLDREILVNTYLQSSTSMIIKRTKRWFPILEKILKEEKIPDDFKYLAVIESALTQAVSPVGAQGFWQFMPYTAKEYNLKITPEIDERLDIVKSTRAACAYLRKAKDTLKDWALAAASYNRGIGGVQRDLKWQKATSYFDMEQNSETGRYFYRILALKIILENQVKYGYNIPDYQKYPVIKTKAYKVTQSIPNLSDWALQRGSNFKILRLLNPWILKTHLTIKKDTFSLLLPLPSEKLTPINP
jgi:membrane-bound lytic murein transglycosylase D